MRPDGCNLCQTIAHVAYGRPSVPRIALCLQRRCSFDVFQARKTSSAMLSSFSFTARQLGMCRSKVR